MAGSSVITLGKTLHGYCSGFTRNRALWLYIVWEVVLKWQSSQCWHLWEKVFTVNVEVSWDKSHELVQLYSRDCLEMIDHSVVTLGGTPWWMLRYPRTQSSLSPVVILEKQPWIVRLFCNNAWRRNSPWSLWRSPVTQNSLNQ